MRDTTLPTADMSQDRSRFGGITMPTIEKIVLHTTESAGWPAYPNFAPQLTADLVAKKTRQHMPINKSASTLRDPSTTAVRENRDNVLQIEMVGYCDPARRSSPKHIDKWGDEEYDYLASILVWVHKEWGTSLGCSVEFIAYRSQPPSSAGLRNGVRLSGAQYDAYRGILGHQHASGNDHGDPGNIKIERLLELINKRLDPTPTLPPAGPTPGTPPGAIRPPLPTLQVRYPMPGAIITTAFGVPGNWMWGKHTGVDFNWPDQRDDRGATAIATQPSRVHSLNSWGSAYGNHVVLQLPNGRRALYAHLSKIDAKTGQQCYPNTKIGEVGDTGNATGPHLHYEERVSPYRYERINGTVVCDAVAPVFPADLPRVSLSKVQTALELAEKPGLGLAGANDGVQVQQALNWAMITELAVDGVLDREWRELAAQYQSIMYEVTPAWPMPGYSPVADGILGVSSLRRLGLDVLP